MARIELTCRLGLAGVLVFWCAMVARGKEPNRVFRAGAASVDITPTELPVIVSGGFREKSAAKVQDRLASRALVLDDGATRLAIVVVDNLMMPRLLLDTVKRAASESTGIPADRMLIAATHSHSAPSAMGALGSRADANYLPVLSQGIARSIKLAADNLAPARIGWAVVQDPAHNHCRRWIFRPDRMSTDPFGQRNVRAHMHPGYQSPNHIGPAGPADTDLSLLAVQTPAGQPLAVLANYAMHYYGATPVSADVCGRFGDKLAALIGQRKTATASNAKKPGGISEFVGILSQGTSGDSMWMDYSQPAPSRDLDAYAQALARVAAGAYRSIEFHDWVPLAMAETTLNLHRRTPDNDRLKWARAIVAQLGDRLPASLHEVYACEQVYLHERPVVELKLQAVRIGELGIAAIPDEVYGITGLKLKAQSPLAVTFNMELSNGAEGYIPPPEQHALGGYTTWPARTAGLEVQAEPKIVEALLALLVNVAGSHRRPLIDPAHDYSKAVLASRPTAFWRLGELAGTVAHDATGKHDGQFESGVAFYLPGPNGKGLDGGPRGNRAVQFAGGRVRTGLDTLGETYSAEMWIWNGLPIDVRPVTGYFFSIGQDGDQTAAGDHLGIGGTFRGDLTGKLIFFNGNERDQVLVGSTVLPLKTWNHVALVREGRRVTVYLNGQEEPQIRGEVDVSRPAGSEVFLGGRCDHFAPLEGRLDEVAVYDRALSAADVARHFKSSGYRPPPAPEKPPAVGSDVPAKPDSPPLSPAEGMAALHVREGYRAELVAAEPLVVDPVAIAWGPDGRLWVAEMADYPLGMDGKGKPGGRVRFLEDVDRDGHYDRSTVFLDGLNFPNGVMPWRKGVLVTAAPELFYAEDTNGDGKADKREVLLSGFMEGNQQLRVNGLRWGLDNWVYCASGSHQPAYAAKSRIRSQKTGQLVALGSRDFRFRPDTGEIEPQSGPTQFGRTRDDWGNWYGCMNSRPLWQYVLRDHYLKRNPFFAPPDPRHQIVVPLNPRVYPAKTPQKRYHSFQQSGRFTSACSPLIYRDELLFPRAAGDVPRGPSGQDSQVATASTYHTFSCEPTHNLVQHNILNEEGVSFAAHRDEHEVAFDFFASRDRWCRPVMVRTGPDGALWVVDMYRYMIEHPQWLPPEGRKELEPFYRSGDDRGRIYRVFPEGRPPRPVPRLDQMSTVELVSVLAHPSGIVRDLAQQLLVWRADKAAVEPLVRMAVSAPQPLGRLHALCTLDGLGAVTEKLLLTSLRDAHGGVRRHAVRLAERWAIEWPEVRSAAEQLVDDPDPTVRLQLAFTLGEWDDEPSATALARLALQDAGDQYLAAAVMSSVGKQNIDGVLKEVLARQPGASSGTLVGRLLALSVSFGAHRATLNALNMVLKPGGAIDRGGQYGIVAGMLDALRRHGTSLERLAAGDAQLGRAVQQRVAQLTQQARADIQDDEAQETRRIAAVGLLGRDSKTRGSDIGALAELLVPQTPLALQKAVVTHLGTLNDAAVAPALLAEWRSHGLSVRAEILRVLSTRKPWLTRLLDDIEAGNVLPADIDAGTRQALLVYGDRAIRDRLTRLLATSGDEDRQKVLHEYVDVLKMKGDAQRGIVVFKNKCTVCHKLDGTGYDIGPNLASITDRRPIALLTSLLDPSAVVDGKFISYAAVTVEGRIFSGIVASETAGSIALLGQENKREVILRNQIDELTSTGKSLMPDGLEKELSRQDMADVMAYLSKPPSTSVSTTASK